MSVEPLVAAPTVPAAPLAPAPFAVSSELDLPLAPAGGLNGAAPAGAGSFAKALEGALAGAGTALERASRAERSFASGRGGLQEMVVERAQADIALSLATAAATRAVGALTTLLGMQV